METRYYNGIFNTLAGILFLRLLHMSFSDKLKTTTIRVKDNGVFIVAILITIVMYLPKIVPVPVPFPSHYPVANPSMDVAVKAFKDKNYDIALAQFLALAEAGDPLAQLMAGTMYNQGEGVKRDLCQSTFWIDKAARQGDFNSQLRMYYAYNSYLGINFDTDKAYLWLKAAKMNRHKDRSISWFNDITGSEDDLDAIFNMLTTFYTDTDRRRLDKVFAAWDYTSEPPVQITRIRNIPYVNGASIVTPAIKPCY